MGCDGGTIPRRDELVVTKKRPEQKDKDAELFFRWRMCALSQTPLQEPIVACKLGRLYNKEAVLQNLIDRASGSSDDALSHVKNMKDIKVLHLSSNPAYKGQSADKGDVYIDRAVAPYICPVVGIEMNGKFKFVALWSCGCVLSEKSIKEMKTDVCHKCQKPFVEDDIILLNATGDDLDALQKRIDEKRTNGKSEKKKGEKRNNEGKPLAPEKKLKLEKEKTQKDEPSASGSRSDLVPNCKGDARKIVKSDVYKSIFASNLPKKSHQTNWITHTTF